LIPPTIIDANADVQIQIKNALMLSKLWHSSRLGTIAQTRFMHRFAQTLHRTQLPSSRASIKSLTMPLHWTRRLSSPSASTSMPFNVWPASSLRAQTGPSTSCSTSCPTLSLMFMIKWKARDTPTTLLQPLELPSTKF
jgi:hypothetical protein